MATYNPGFGFPPSRGYNPPHYGIDFPGMPGSSIPAAANGVVWFSDYNKGYGWTVILRHVDASGNAFYSLYAHMNSQNDMPALGSTVEQGQKIGEVGNTGTASRGNHLHFEVIDPAVDDMSDPRFLSENPRYGGIPTGETGPNGEQIFSTGLKEGGEFRYDPDSFFDNWSVTDIFDGRFTPYLIPSWLWSLYGDNFGIPDSLSRYFTLATQWVWPRRDPLTLDLDGDGIETVGINTNNPILFDHDGDGVKTATGWMLKAGYRLKAMG